MTRDTPTLARFTRPRLIIAPVRGRDAAGAIQELSQSLEREGRVRDGLAFYHAVMSREALVSTEMEAGMAFPHARLPGLKELTFAFGRSDAPLVWGANRVPSVRLIFLMAVPALDTTQYLSLISGLARLAKNRQLVEQLQAAPDPLQIFAVLQQISLGTRPTPGAHSRP